MIAETIREPKRGSPLPLAWQQRIAQMIAAGASHRETAEALGLSKRTVDKYAGQKISQQVCPS